MCKRVYRVARLSVEQRTNVIHEEQNIDQSQAMLLQCQIYTNLIVF